MPSQNTGSKADTNDAIATSASMKWSYQVSQYSPPRPSSDYQKVSSRSETFYQFHQASQTSETYAHRNHRIILLTAEVPVVLVHTSSALMLSVVQCVSIQTWRQCAMAPSAVRHCSAVQWHQWPLAGAREHPAARGSNKPPRHGRQVATPKHVVARNPSTPLRLNPRRSGPMTPSCHCPTQPPRLEDWQWAAPGACVARPRPPPPANA